MLSPHPVTFSNGGLPACEIVRFKPYTLFFVYNGHGTLSLKVHYRLSDDYGGGGDNHNWNNDDPGDPEPPNFFEKIIGLMYILSAVVWFYLTAYSAVFGNWKVLFWCVGWMIVNVIILRFIGWLDQRKK